LVFDFYATQFPALDFSSGFAFAFMALEPYLGFVELLSNTIAEVCSCKTQCVAICSFNKYRLAPEESSGTFETSL
jgi:hypothetical protein